MFSKKIVSLFVLANFLMGCMTYNGAMLPRAVNEKPATLPVIELKVGDFTQTINGIGKSAGIEANTTMATQTVGWIANGWKQKKLIAKAGPIGKLKTSPDYTLTISGSRDEQFSIGGAIATGATFYLYPSSSVLTYDLSFDLKDNKTGRSYTVKAKDFFTVWQELFYILAFPVFFVGSMHMQQEMAAYVYSEFSKQGAFQ